MICDVSTIVNTEGAQVALEGCLESVELACDIEVIKASVSGSIANSGGVLVLEAEVSAEIKTSCARCLKEIVMPLDFDFSETLVLSGQETDADADSVIFFEGTEIDVGEIAINNLLLNVSTKYLCRDDCKGICPKCGKNLNEVSCDCDFFEIDPRWEKLKNFK
ncbi:MAG: DUF177 domain-containing protein [Clostridia bacterium]|nr:DUF177 domain-containing protein [Clostridia bacterium]